MARSGTSTGIPRRHNQGRRYPIETLSNASIDVLMTGTVTNRARIEHAGPAPLVGPAIAVRSDTKRLVGGARV